MDEDQLREAKEKIMFLVEENVKLEEIIDKDWLLGVEKTV